MSKHTQRATRWSPLVSLLVAGLALACSKTVDVGALPDSDATSETPDSAVDGTSDAEHDETASETPLDTSTDVPSGEGADASDATDTGPVSLESFGLTGHVFPFDIAVQPLSGETAATGVVDPLSSVDFGGGVLKSTGATVSAFLATFDATGHHLWSTVFPNGDSAYGRVVGIDHLGNVYAAGMFGDVGRDIDLGCGGPVLAKGRQDLYLARFDSKGKCLWAQTFGAPGPGNLSDVRSLAVDFGGDVFIAGNTMAADFGGGTVGSGTYIAKFDSAGVYQWVKMYSDSSVSINHFEIRADGKGNIVFAGDFWGTADFGAGPWTAPHMLPDAFIVQLDSSGKLNWAKRYVNGDVALTGVAVGTVGDIFVGGLYGYYPIDFGTGPLPASDTSNRYVFLAKIDSTGTGVWANSFASTGPDCSTPNECGAVDVQVAVTDALAPVVAAKLYGGPTAWVDFGGGHLFSSGLLPGPPWDRTVGSGTAVAAFDASGKYKWGHASGPTSTADYATPVAVGLSATTAVVGGGFGTRASAPTAPPGTTLVLGGKTLTSVAAGDLFLIHLPL